MHKKSGPLPRGARRNCRWNRHLSREFKRQVNKGARRYARNMLRKARYDA